MRLDEAVGFIGGASGFTVSLGDSRVEAKCESVDKNKLNNNDSLQNSEERIDLYTKFNGQGLRSVIKKSESRNFRVNYKRVNFEKKERGDYFGNNVGILISMNLKCGQKTSIKLEKENKTSDVVLHSILVNRANANECVEEVELCTKYKAGNSLDNFYPEIREFDETSTVGNEIVDKVNDKPCKYIEDRFKEYKIVYECENDVANKAKRLVELAALRRLYSADYHVEYGNG